MAYFSNGTSGMVYVEKYCSRCRNWKDLGDDKGFGCPIWDLHTVHNYDQVKNKDIKRILESFIPTKDDGFPGQCLMFKGIDGEIEGQLHLFKGKQDA
jgi:hypothetical protein